MCGVPPGRSNTKCISYACRTACPVSIFPYYWQITTSSLTSQHSSHAATTRLGMISMWIIPSPRLWPCHRPSSSGSIAGSARRDDEYKAAMAGGGEAMRPPEALRDDAHLHDRGFWKQVEHSELGRSFV